MRKVTNGVLVAILLTVALVVGVNAQAVATNSNWVVTKLLTVTDAATFTSSVFVFYGTSWIQIDESNN